MGISSMLDDDLYKFTMGQAVHQLYPRAYAEYAFIDRSELLFNNYGVEAFKKGFNALAELRAKNRTHYMSSREFLEYRCPFFTPVYLDFLYNYQYDLNEVTWTFQEREPGKYKLHLKIAGPWYRTILWEVKLLALISESYHIGKRWELNQNEDLYGRGTSQRDIYKFRYLLDLPYPVVFADFGTRRRYSYVKHYQVVLDARVHGGTNFAGTSNVNLAYLHAVKPIGTQAHEWFMFHGAVFGYRMATRLALEHWVDVYQGDLGIALSDTFTSDAFFRSFDKKYAKLFDGVRHDSGDPIEFTEKTIAHYEKLGINPKTKTIVFSDSLTPNLIKEIARNVGNRIQCSYGIGTNLTCDIPGVEPANIVIKMTGCSLDEKDGLHKTIKLSDVESKHTGDPKEIEICKKVLDL